MQVSAITRERQRVKPNKSPVEAICIRMGLEWDLNGTEWTHLYTQCGYKVVITEAPDGYSGSILHVQYSAAQFPENSALSCRTDVDRIIKTLRFQQRLREGSSP
jgi:hypothetical protein